MHALWNTHDELEPFWPLFKLRELPAHPSRRQTKDYNNMKDEMTDETTRHDGWKTILLYESVTLHIGSWDTVWHACKLSTQPVVTALQVLGKQALDPLLDVLGTSKACGDYT